MDILQAAISGDTSAYNQLVMLHREGAMILAMRLLRNRQDAEDVVQDGFVRAWMELKGFRGESTFASWLYRIVYNLSLNRLRGRKLRSFFHLADEKEDEEFYLNLPNDDPTPHEAYVYAERREHLEKALKRLPAKQRAVFEMRHVQELSNAEIAKATGKTEGSVKANFSFAVSKLKVALVDYQ